MNHALQTEIAPASTGTASMAIATTNTVSVSADAVTFACASPTICTTKAFDKTTAGHTAHFVSDRLTMLVPGWKVLSPRDNLIWLQLMVRTRIH